MKAAPLLLVAALALGLAGLGAWRAGTVSGQGTVTSVVAPSSWPLDGGDFDVEIRVEDIENLGAYEWELTYDPAVLELVEVVNGSFLGSTGRPVFCLDPVLDEGSVRLGCVTMGPEPPGPTGSGVLSVLTFSPVANGASPLDLSSVQLCDPLANDLPTGTVCACIAIGEGASCDTLSPTSTPTATATATPTPTATAVLDQDGDGIPDSLDACPALPEDVDEFQDADGCPEADNDTDGLLDGADQCPGTDWTAGPDGVADSGDEPLDELGLPIRTKEDYDGVIDTDGCHDSPSADYDSDGLTDDDEVFVHGTDPTIPDSDGDGCADGEEPAGAPAPKPGSTGAYDPLAWYDFYDVPAGANPDPAPNGPRNGTIDIADALAMLFYVFADEGGPPNGNGVSYDIVKGSCDIDADTTPDREGLCYDRTPGEGPNPPWGAGPPNGAIDMGDVLGVMSQFGLECSGP